MTSEEIDGLYEAWVEALPMAALFIANGNASGGFEAHKTCQDVAVQLHDIDQETIAQLDAGRAGKLAAVRIWSEVRPR